MRNQALVAALQWGLVQTFLLDTLGRLLRNYYRATIDSFVPPSWVTSIQFAAPLALFVGGYGGYRWVTSGRATTTLSTHRTRIVFVGTLLVGWALAIVPTLVFQWVLGDRLFTVPYFLLPTLTALGALLLAYLFAYRADIPWYRLHRGKSLGAVQGAFVGGITGAIGFTVYVRYLLGTQTNFSLNGGPGIVVAVCLGAFSGYVLTDAKTSGERTLKFLTLLLLTLFGSTLLSVVGVYAFAIAGITTDAFDSILIFLSPIVLAVLIAGYLTYGARTAFYRHLTGSTGR